MDLLEMNMKNRSCRGYDESYKVSKETLEELVNLTRFAPASVNIQPMKYYLSWTDEQNAVIQPLTGWARQLPGNNLPYPGHRPTAFIVILHDKNVAPNVARFSKDVGIAAQTIALGAVEKGLNVCMIGNFSPEKVAQALSLPENLEVVLIIAVGKQDEKIVLTEIDEGEDTAYYRDENDVHYVPKRKLKDIIVNI